MDANQADDHALAEQTALASKHPDYREVAGSEPFTTWLANQPPMVIEAVQRNNERIVNADETSFVLDLFKSTLEAPTPEPAPEPEPQPEPEPDPEPEQQPASSRRALQRKSASAPSTSTVSSAADGPKDDFDAAFDHYAGKIDA
jgi:outer membrane biosynthesis protein TonB